MSAQYAGSPPSAPQTIERLSIFQLQRWLSAQGAQAVMNPDGTVYVCCGETGRHELWSAEAIGRAVREHARASLL